MSNFGSLCSNTADTDSNANRDRWGLYVNYLKKNVFKFNQLGFIYSFAVLKAMARLKTHINNTDLQGSVVGQL